MSTNRSRVMMWRVVFASAFLFVVARRSYCEDASAHAWKAPARAAKKQNPFPPDADTVAAGKKVFVGNCLECHGSSGRGDGPDAMTCNPRPANLSDPKTSAQPDGELFWKITEGKEAMPGYEKLLPETDRWKVIDYIRVLSKPPPGNAPQGR